VLLWFRKHEAQHASNQRLGDCYGSGSARMFQLLHVLRASLAGCYHGAHMLPIYALLVVAGVLDSLGDLVA
jgi:hypothetical protein